MGLCSEIRYDLAPMATARGEGCRFSTLETTAAEGDRGNAGYGQGDCGTIKGVQEGVFEHGFGREPVWVYISGDGLVIRRTAAQNDGHTTTAIELSAEVPATPTPAVSRRVMARPELSSNRCNSGSQPARRIWRSTAARRDRHAC